MVYMVTNLTFEELPRECMRKSDCGPVTFERGVAEFLHFM